MVSEPRTVRLLRLLKQLQAAYDGNTLDVLKAAARRTVVRSFPDELVCLHLMMRLSSNARTVGADRSVVLARRVFALTVMVAVWYRWLLI